ncbi:MAG: tyrosine-type recombinase/integrase [Deltaproteobacteria bacterium]|nr:tyrosine-type recombinase/integrase [Deltaproteobacteria bacterium]
MPYGVARRKERIDLFRRSLAILEQKNRGKDTLPLNSHAIELLKARGKVRSNHIFFNREGNRIDAANLQKAFNIAWAKAALAKLRFHELRHTSAARLVQAGVDLYKVQKLMRHKTPIMT